jgi:glycosyltransferase involved in cell wall biosynthesis
VPLHEGVKVAVNVTLCPTVELAGEALIVVVLASADTTEDAASKTAKITFFMANAIMSVWTGKSTRCSGMARIALVHDVAGVAATQAQILRGAGHEVEHIQMPQFGAGWSWLAKALTLPIRLLLYLPVVLRLRRGRYDVIHIHWVPRGIVGLLAGRPFLIQAHGSDLHVELNVPGVFRLNRRVLESARTIFYVTPNLEPYVHRFHDKLCYLPNPIDLRSGPAAAAPPASVRSIVIFMRLDPVKGVRYVFPALRHLAASMEVTALAWGPLTHELTRRYGDVVRFVPPVPHEKVGRFLAQFDLVVGQMEQGALGLSELEAMAAGRPLICGINRDLYPGDKPPVVSSYSADELIEQVEVLKNDSRRLENLSREGRAWVRRNHGFERHLALLETAYFGTPARVSEMPIAM